MTCRDNPRVILLSAILVSMVLCFIVTISLTIKKDEIDREFNTFETVQFLVWEIKDSPRCLDSTYRDSCFEFKQNSHSCIDYIVTLKEYDDIAEIIYFEALCGNCICNRDWLEIFTTGEIVTIYRKIDNHATIQVDPPPNSRFLDKTLFCLVGVMLGLFATAVFAKCMWKNTGVAREVGEIEEGAEGAEIEEVAESAEIGEDSA